MKHYTVLLLLILPILTFGQQGNNKEAISKSTNKVVKKIVKINELMGSAVYYRGTRPKQWDNFEKLKNNFQRRAYRTNKYIDLD